MIGGRQQPAFPLGQKGFAMTEPIESRKGIRFSLNIPFDDDVLWNEGCQGTDLAAAFGETLESAWPVGVEPPPFQINFLLTPSGDLYVDVDPRNDIDRGGIHNVFRRKVYEYHLSKDNTLRILGNWQRCFEGDGSECNGSAYHVAEELPDTVTLPKATAKSAYAVLEWKFMDIVTGCRSIDLATDGLKECLFDTEKFENLPDEQKDAVRRFFDSF